MGKTKRTYLDLIPSSRAQKKKLKAKKHFGYTSGIHSQWDKYKTEKDGAYPVKNENFVKYGYPSEIRKGSFLKNLMIERAKDAELKEVMG